MCNEYVMYIVYAVNIYNRCSEYIHTNAHTLWKKSHASNKSLISEGHSLNNISHW